MSMNYITYYLVAVNSITFFLSAFDKRAAVKHRRRVPEKTLFLFASFGGSLGLYLSMLLLRHKTKHWLFMVGVPVLIILQAVVLRQLYV